MEFQQVSQNSHKNGGSGVIRLMEVCGTHTMAIARSGIRQILPENVKLLSGPGCPVCVTPPEVIDAVLRLTERPTGGTVPSTLERPDHGAGVSAAGIATSADESASGSMGASGLDRRSPFAGMGKPVCLPPIITTYGDMLRVPGSVKGDSLLRRKALGADVRMVYSPLDAVRIAKENPEQEVVFLGIGFETSAPGTAAAIEAAIRADIPNFSVFSMLKMLQPSIRALAADPAFNVQGFLCPGHVAVILGEEGMRFFADELHFPAVISGFETGDLLQSIRMLLRQIRTGEARLENEYTSVVSREGNREALALMERYLIPRDDLWRGLGMIPESGYGIREEFARFDAERKFDVRILPAAARPLCRCGDVIRGMLRPEECPMFGTACTPEDPEGPCMVSSEGACAAAWKYK